MARLFGEHNMYSEVVQLAQQMVAIPSINPEDTHAPESPYGESRMADFLCDWLKKYGLDCRRQQVQPGRENVISLAEGRDRSRTLLLSAHMDTVDVKGMTIEPFEPAVRQGRLYGRGSCDTKGPLAALMLAFRDRVLSGPLPCNLVLLATCGEEYNMLGASHYARLGDNKPAAAVFAEPTGFNVVVAHKGAVRLKMTCYGTSAHSSTPDLGENAIYTMTTAITAVQDYDRTFSAEHADVLLGRETITVTIVRGGQQINVIPDRCEAQIDWRTLPGRNPDRCREQLYQLLTEKIPPEKISLELLSAYNSIQTDPSSPLIQAVLAAADKTVHKRNITAAAYTTDAGAFKALNIPTCIFGPGDPAQAHTQGEYIELEQLQNGYLAYKAFLDADWAL